MKIQMINKISSALTASEAIIDKSGELNIESWVFVGIVTIAGD